MIFCEYASPMPGSASNSSLVAVLMSSLPAAFAFSDCLEAADVCALLLEPLPFAWADISEGAANINSAISVIASLLTFSPRELFRADATSAFQSCTQSRAAHSCRAVTNLVYRMASFLNNTKEETTMKSFLTGLGTGIALGVLFAPRSGDQTRQQLRESADQLTDS